MMLQCANEITWRKCVESRGRPALYSAVKLIGLGGGSVVELVGGSEAFVAHFHVSPPCTGQAQNRR